MSPVTTRFIILSAARTGSTLLRYMLASHPGVFAGGEIFNPIEIKQRIIAWCDPSDEHAVINTDERLLRLRESDPIRFLNELIRITETWGYSAIGIKWQYWDPLPQDPIAQYLFGDKSIRVIHLKRRNLLRQMVSYERAVQTDHWAQTPGQAKIDLPALTLPVERVLEYIAAIEAKEHEYQRGCSDHPMLELYYEDMAKDPQAAGRQALEFLGVTPTTELAILTEKQSSDSLRDAITNYQELRKSIRGTIRRRRSFFEE